MKRTVQVPIFCYPWPRVFSPFTEFTELPGGLYRSNDCMTNMPGSWMICMCHYQILTRIKKRPITTYTISNFSVSGYENWHYNSGTKRYESKGFIVPKYGREGNDNAIPHRFFADK